MGIFDKFFGSKKEESDKNIFYAKKDEKIKEASKRAIQTFKYFWRETYWEYRRIVPAHDLAIVKIPFEQNFQGNSEPVVEHMWINQIEFDGEKVKGILMNSPRELTNIAEGDFVEVEIDKISDWMLAIQGNTYGAFTVQVLRSEMSEKERKQHDNAWGLDFGDYNDILYVYDQKEHPENLIEHPMSKNMEENTREYYTQNPESIHSLDKNGYTTLQIEVIAGNKNTVAILLELGANKSATSASGKTALDYAKKMNWEHILPLLG